MEKNTDHRHIVVSGGGRGLGLEIVRSLAREGYRISTFGRTITDTIKSCEHDFKDRFYFRSVDINASESLRKFIRDAVDANGDIYGVVNNAAIAQEGILATLPEIEIHRMISTNLESVIRLTRLCLRSMIRTPEGRVVNISSIIGTRGYNGLTVYSATKAGVDGFTRSLAREVGRRKVTVNSVAPGYMETEMSAGLSTGQMGQIVRRTPLGRLTRVEDVIPMILFLLSDKAGMITGQTILIDGGISC